MKKLIFLFLILILIPAIGIAETITLEWDYPENQAIDGFKLFMKKKVAENFDYLSPVATLEPTARSVAVDAPTVANKVQGYDFVLRAIKGELESADSNSVQYYVVGVVPAAPTALNGEYNKETSIISLSWEQPIDEYDIWQWIVYYRMEGQTEFSELGRVDKGQALILTEEFDKVAEGEEGTAYFTVVSFRRDYTVHSENSMEFALVIDRTGPPIPPENLKINIEIPVQ